MPSENTVDDQQNIKQIIQERDMALTNYEKLQKAHNTLKDDLKELKTAGTNVSELEKQINEHLSEKANLLQASNALQAQFETFKREMQQKEKRQAISVALTDQVKTSAITTAMKLIDLNSIEINEKGEAKTETIQAAVDALKASDPVLFKDSDSENFRVTPPVRHAVDRLTKSAYEAEIADAIKKADAKLLEEVVAKYSK
jgi:hypothetical protein